MFDYNFIEESRQECDAQAFSLKRLWGGFIHQRLKKQDRAYSVELVTATSDFSPINLKTLRKNWPV